MSSSTTTNSNNLITEISEIEANLAFFEARFSLIQHQPDSTYKRAQLKAYQYMHNQLTEQLDGLKAQQELYQSKKN